MMGNTTRRRDGEGGWNEAGPRHPQAAYPATEHPSKVFVPLGRRSHAAPYESVTFPLVTRAGRELTVTLSAQPVFDLALSVPITRRIRRTIRRVGGEQALTGLGRRTLEPADLQRIDTQTLHQGLDLLKLGSSDSGVLPAFWRTIATTRGRFSLLCTEMQHERQGTLLVEIMGGLEQAPADALRAAIGHFETETQGAILHIAPDVAAVRRLKGVNARCLCLDFAGVAHENARDWALAAQLIGTCRQVSGQVMLLNLRPDRGLAAHQSGATHAVFAGMNAISV